MTGEREIILPVTLAKLLPLTKDRLEKIELILSIKSLTLSSGTFMEWSSEFHKNPNHSKNLQIVFSLLTTDPALFNVYNTKLASALQLLISKVVPQPSSKYNTIRIPC
jgi:hypothetical protein